VLMAAAAFMKAKSVIDGMTFALNLLNIKIGATGAITTGTLIPSVAKISTNFGLLGTLTTGPIGIAAVAIGGLYLAWKTNLFGMRDITREAIADIKGNFTNLSDFLQSGGGGGAGAFFDEKPILPEISTDDFQNQMEADAKAAEDMAARVKEATESLVNIMQPTYDKLYEMSHTAEESAVRNLTAQKDAAIEAVKALELATDEQAAAIAKITELYNAEVDLIIAKIEEEKEAKRLEIETTVVGELAKMKAIREGLKPYDELIAKVNEAATATEESVARQIGAMKMVKDITGNITIESDYGIKKTGSYEEAQAIVAANVKSYDVGTPSVPKTGLALVHEGEEINPPGKRSYDQSKSYSPTVNITVQGNGNAEEIKKVVEQALEESRRQYSRGGYQMAY